MGSGGLVPMIQRRGAGPKLPEDEISFIYERKILHKYSSFL